MISHLINISNLIEDREKEEKIRREREERERERRRKEESKDSSEHDHEIKAIREHYLGKISHLRYLKLISW